MNKFRIIILCAAFIILLVAAYLILVTIQDNEPELLDCAKVLERKKECNETHNDCSDDEQCEHEKCMKTLENSSKVEIYARYCAPRDVAVKVEFPGHYEERK